MVARAALVAVATAAAPGRDHGSAPPLPRTPRILSCGHHGEWAEFRAVLAGAAARRPPPTASPVDEEEGLPEVCREVDDVVAGAAAGVIERHLPPDNVIDAFDQMNRRCDPDSAPGVAECPIETAWAGRVPCLYGLVSASVCLANMCLHNADEMAGRGFFLDNFASGLVGMLWGDKRLLEFLDASSWPFTAEDVALIVDSFARRSASHTSPHGRPWTRESAAWLEIRERAQRSLALVSGWHWPPLHARQLGVAGHPQSEPTGYPRSLNVWVYGTHCSVVAEPVSVLARIFASEFLLDVAWRGVKDYCKFHSSDRLGPQQDRESLVYEVTRTYLAKRETDHPHQDVLRRPAEFARKLRAALELDRAFQAADLAICSEPAYACGVIHGLGKPLVGYFGVHIGFLLDEEEDQVAFYRTFRDRLARDPRSTFATKAPYISMQIFYHTSVEVPAVRPASLYTLPAVYTPTRSEDVLVNKRPGRAAGWLWDVAHILQVFATEGAQSFRFVAAQGLQGSSWEEWASFRAGVYFPYEWLQTMALYDWVNMAIPTFVPDSPLYTYTQGTNHRDEWAVTLGDPLPADVYPHHYADWNDVRGRAYWWLLTDFSALPGIVGFASIGDLFARIASQPFLWSVSQRLREAYVMRVGLSSAFWHGAVHRALGLGAGCLARTPRPQ